MATSSSLILECSLVQDFQGKQLELPNLRCGESPPNGLFWNRKRENQITCQSQ